MVGPKATAWRVLHASERGSAHYAGDLPNQDAVAVGLGEPTVVAIADGHGSLQSVRSHRGAALAVDVAVRHARQPMQPTSEHLSVLAERIASDWRTSVMEDFVAHPLTGRELDLLGAHHTVASDPLRLYGSTLIVAIAGTAGVGLLQLGDGDVVVRTSHGEVVRPVPDDPALVAGETTSLCMPDALRSFRFAVLDVIDEPIDFVLMATDGYGNAFADVTWPTHVSSDIADHLRAHGTEWIDEHLSGWLAESALVGGDDVTVAILVAAPRDTDRQEGDR